MTRWLLLLFVFVMPVQFAWSAAAVYCGHEAAPASFHLGHHAHQHTDSDAGALDGEGAVDTADDSLPRPHADCGYCHASMTQLPIDLPGVAESPYRHGLQRPAQQGYASRIEPDIDRPKWTRAA